MGGAANGAAGGAALFNPFSGITAAASNLLNLTTYYQMKERAGMIGRTAVNDLVKAVVARLPDVKLHVIGHSFGARLVTSLALGKEGVQPQKFASMTLLQAAFSHNGFADKFKTTGFFRNVVAEHRIGGPILVTCTANDKAVGLAYPLASLIAGQNAAGFGGPTDPFGGLGRNGAQNTTEAVAGELRAGGQRVRLQGRGHLQPERRPDHQRPLGHLQTRGGLCLAEVGGDHMSAAVLRIGDEGRAGHPDPK